MPQAHVPVPQRGYPAISERTTAVAFKLTERSIWPGCHEIAIEGELDLAVSEELRSALDRAVTEDLHVLVDLAGCEFIDAGGLAVLVRADEKLRFRGRQLLLYGVGGQVRRMLSVTALAGTTDGLTIASGAVGEAAEMDGAATVTGGPRLSLVQAALPRQEAAASRLAEPVS
jgi:anti-sigma B factor antagonist